jgi:hypothetical protein
MLPLKEKPNDDLTLDLMLDKENYLRVVEKDVKWGLISKGMKGVRDSVITAELIKLFGNLRRLIEYIEKMKNEGRNTNNPLKMIEIIKIPKNLRMKTRVCSLFDFYNYRFMKNEMLIDEYNGQEVMNFIRTLKKEIIDENLVNVVNYFKFSVFFVEMNFEWVLILDSEIQPLYLWKEETGDFEFYNSDFLKELSD